MLGGKEKKDEFVGTPVQVMLDGPYGGCSIDLGQYETVLLVAGGSGATFTLSLLDDIVARCVKMGRSGGEKTRRIEFAWCIRSFGERTLLGGYLRSRLANIAFVRSMHRVVCADAYGYRFHGRGNLPGPAHLRVCHMPVQP